VSTPKQRLAALALLDRALASVTDDELGALIAALPEDHRAALDEMAGGSDASSVRQAANAGRMNGTLERMAVVLTDPCLAACITALGDASDDPSEEQLREVLPGLVDGHGMAVVRLMLASAVAGEAKAAPVITPLLTKDETYRLPPVERHPTPAVAVPDPDDPERAELKARRKDARKRKQEQAKARREQAQAARRS
jgi:hypothetical protein